MRHDATGSRGFARLGTASARNLAGGLGVSLAAAALFGWAAGSGAVAAMTAAVSTVHVAFGFRARRVRGPGWFAFPLVAGLLFTGVEQLLRRFYAALSGGG